MRTRDSHLDVAWWTLKISLGVAPIITGIDKYFDRLADWGMYLSPLANKVLPVSTAAFMHTVGAVEIIAGLVVLSRWTRVGAYVLMVWLLGIVLNLLTTGMFYDLAMRDFEIAISAFILAQLTVARTKLVVERERVQAPVHEVHEV